MFFSGLNLSPDVIRNAIASTQPVAATRVPAASVGIGGQTTQPVAPSPVPAAQTYPDWGAYAKKYPEVVAEYNRTKPSMSLGTFAIQHYNKTGKAKGYEVPTTKPYTPPVVTYSDTTTSYLKQLDDYIAGLGTPEYGGYRRDDPLLATYKSSPNYMGLITPSVQRSEADMLPYIGKPVAENTLYYFNTRTNQGDLSAPADVWVRSNTPLVLYDANKKEVVYAGTGVQAGQQIAKLSDQMSKTEGKKANWVIFQGEPGTTDPSKFTPVAYDTKDKGVLGQIADFALPIIGAIALPGLGILGGTVGAAAGSAAGSALSGALQGEALNDILKKAAISGAATLAGGELLKGIGSTPVSSSVSGGLDAATQAAVSAGLESAPITVVGSPLAGVASSAISGLTGSQLSNALSGIAEATKPQIPSVIETAVQPPAPAPAPTPIPPVEAPPIVVTGQITPRIEDAVGAIVGGAGIGELTRLGYSQAEIDAAIKEAQSRQDTVTATKPPSAIPIVPGIFSSGPPPTMSNQEIADKVLADQEKGGLSTLEKIRLGLLGADLISGLFKPGADNSTYTDKSGPLSYTPLNRQQAVPNFDVFTYGQDLPSAQRGEFLFFPPAGVQTTQPVANTTVPASQKLAKGGEVEDGDMHDDMVKHLMAYRSGGGHMGPGKVKGIGSGQEDLIPAWLSDGEYVWSAQDVADLGDGSTDEGVRRLDKMREMVRKQAGRKNVKKIAKPQKGIESMLKAVGGRV